MPQVVVITGASAGVGRALVREFAKQGAKIALIARGFDGLNAACREVKDLGGDALPFPADVSDPELIEDAAERIEERLGPIDIWINNAMVSVFSEVKLMTSRDYKRVTEVTYLGTVYGTQAALKRMLPRNRGTIVQVGSALAYRSIPLQSAYCAAKHAVAGFTESLRTELLHEHSAVKVTMVNLPAVNTPQFDWVKSRLPRKAQPVPPIYQPEVAARAIVWAAHHPSRRERALGFSALKAIWAEKFVAGLADHYLARVGFRAQQTTEPYEPRPDNLWEPLPGDRGAHGRFDDAAHAFSVQWWLTTHPGWTALGALLLAIVVRLALPHRETPETAEAPHHDQDRLAG